MWGQVERALHDSMARVMTKIATLLPGLVALLVAVAVFALLGWIAAWLLGRLLHAARLDERMSRFGGRGWASWAGERSASALAARAVFWIFLVIGLLVGVSAFDAASAYALSPYLAGYVPRLLAALVILILGTLFARFLSRTVLISGTNMNLQYARLLSVGAKWLVMVLTAAMVLDHLGIGGEIVDLGFGILFGGIVLALALAVGLGTRDVVSRELVREVREAQTTQQETRQTTLHHF